MAETDTRFANYRYTLRQALSHRVDDCLLVTPDSGEATNLVDANLTDEDDYYNGWSLWFYAGDNINKERTPSDWDLGTNTLTFATVTTAVDTADLAELHRKFTAARYNTVINDAINVAADFFLIPAVDETLVVHAWKEGESRVLRREYDIPSGFDYIDAVYIESSETHELIDCEAVWADLDTDVIGALDNDDYQEGSNSMKFAVGAGISDGDVIGSKDLSAAEDLSMYQKIAFWIKASSALAAGDLCLLLDDTSGCGSAIETIELPAITANTWTFVRCTLAAASSDTAILSIGFEYNANSGANTIWVDDIRAVLQGQPYFAKMDKLDHRDWSIIPDSTPKLKIHRGVTLAPGSAIRLVGQTHQGVFTTDATTETCAVPPEFIIQQAMAFLHQSKGQREDMAAAQIMADAQRRKIQVKPRPFARAVKES